MLLLKEIKNKAKYMDLVFEAGNIKKQEN